MALTGVDALLRRHRAIALDSCVFIYQLEANARYLHLTTPVFDWLEENGHMAATSTVTLTELLVPAYRHSQERFQAYLFVFSTYPNLEWIAPGPEIASLAAQIRARHGLRTPDALQAATAMNTGATLFITNDVVFRRVTGVTTLMLDDLL